MNNLNIEDHKEAKLTKFVTNYISLSTFIIFIVAIETFEEVGREEIPTKE